MRCARVGARWGRGGCRISSNRIVHRHSHIVLRCDIRNTNDRMKAMVREIITLACTECKRRNYTSTKDKKKHPDRLELKKYCRFERKHTLHKETK